MFKCSGCCSCFEKEEEPELDTGYKIDETQQKILVDNKQLKHKISLTVDKKTYIFYMTDKALKQLYEKKQKFLEDIKEGEKNFYNFSIDCFNLSNGKFIILSEDNDYLKKTNNRLSLYCNNSYEKSYLLEIKKIEDNKKIEKIDIGLEEDFVEKLFSNIESSYYELVNGNKKKDNYNGEGKISLSIKEEQSKPTEEKIDAYNAKPGEKQLPDISSLYPKSKLMDWWEKIEEDNFNDHLNKEYKFRLHFDEKNNGIDIDFIFKPECLLNLYTKIMTNKNFNKSDNKYVVLGLSGADFNYPDKQKYVINGFVEGTIGDDGEGCYNLPTPWLAIFFDDFGRISGIQKMSSEGFIQEFNDIKTGDVEYLSRFIKEKGEKLYNGYKVIMNLKKEFTIGFQLLLQCKTRRRKFKFR